MGVQVSGPDDRSSLIDHLKTNGYACLDLSDDELSKVHLRHMVGGRLPASSTASNVQELLYRFEFPERPGALMRFVTALHRDWSISIFHYRNHGADVGRIVVGVLVTSDDLKAGNPSCATLATAAGKKQVIPLTNYFLVDEEE